jgi:hypothetical protein
MNFSVHGIADDANIADILAPWRSRGIFVCHGGRVDLGVPLSEEIDPGTSTSHS